MTSQIGNECFESATLKQLITVFLLETKNENTRRARRGDLNLLCDWLENVLNKREGEVRLPSSIDWTVANTSVFLHERRHLDGINTYARRVANYRKFARFVEKVCPTFENPMSIAGTPPRKEAIPSVLCPEELVKLRQHAAEEALRAIRGFSGCGCNFKPLRTWMLFELMLCTGIKPSELLSVTYDQVDRLRLMLREVPSPAYYLRDVPIAKDLLGLFEAYLINREVYLRESCGCDPKNQEHWSAIPLFPSAYGARLEDPASLRMTLKTQWRSLVGLGAAVGMQGVSPRILRDTFAAQRLAQTFSVGKISDALRLTGWRMGQMRVRRRYLKHAQDLFERHG